jgi:phage terminase large subunit-like protein
MAGLDPDRVAQVIGQLPEENLEDLLVSWHDLWARPEQLAPPGVWRYWAIITGRGWGKNRTAAEWVLDRCQAFADADMPHLVGLFGRTDDDVHQLMLGGDSGLITCAERRGWRIHAPASSRFPKIYVPKPDGSEHVTDCEIHSGTEPDRARGRNFHTVWADEFASWDHVVDAQGNTAFSNMNLGLRGLCPKGMSSQGVVTTTPKPIPVVRELLDGGHGPVALTQGSLSDNRSNLDPSFVKAVIDAYEGTRLEAQEIHGAILDSVEGALWDQATIHRWRIRGFDRLPRMAHIVIGVDPSGSDSGDECGIVACGKGAELDGKNRAHGYVLEDRSIRNRPILWGPEVVKLYWELKDMFPDTRVEVVFETNFGGAMGVDTIKVQDSAVPVREVRASRGKRVRAEPVARLYDQGRWHHVGVFAQLETQMCWWTPLEPTSPDRMDALVWATIGLLPEITAPPAGYHAGFSDLRA